MKLRRFFYQWVRQIVFAEKCLHCEVCLERTRQIVCSICYDYLEPLRLDGVLHLAPFGSLADTLLNTSKNNLKQKALLEALVMRAFLQEIPSGIFYSNIKQLQNSSTLLKFFNATPYHRRLILKGVTVIAFFDKKSTESELFCLKMQISQVLKLIVLYLH